MKKWLKLLFVISIFAIISLILYFVLKQFGMTNINNLKSLVERSNQYGIIIFFLIEVLLFVCFSFVPMIDSALALLGAIIFGPFVNFFVSTLAEIVACSIMFFLGDKCGEKLAVKMIGKKELAHAQDLVDGKSKLFLPVCFLVPIFPEEALSLVAGMTKMKYWYFLSVVTICKAIDIALISFLGGGFINWSALGFIEWFMLINIIIIDLFLLIKYRGKIEKRLKKKNKKELPIIDTSDKKGSSIIPIKAEEDLNSDISKEIKKSEISISHDQHMD